MACSFTLTAVTIFNIIMLDQLKASNAKWMKWCNVGLVALTTLRLMLSAKLEPTCPPWLWIEMQNLLN